jgi:hypothetical protein
MRAMTPESVGRAAAGSPLESWRWGPLYSADDIKRVARRRFTYGSYRPSYYAEQSVDGTVTLPPFDIDMPLAAD